MKRRLASLVIALALFFAPITAIVAPANAATIAKIAGTGTGGNIALQGGSGASISATTNVAVPAGSFIVFALSIRTTSGTNAVTSGQDTAGNTYTCINTIALNANGGLCYSNTTVTLPLGGSIQGNFNVTGLCDIIGSAWTNVASSPLDAASVAPTSGAGTSMNLGTTGTLALGGSNELLIAFESMNTGGTQTDSGGWTDMGTSGSNQAHLAAQLVTATTGVNDTVSSTVSNTWSGDLVGFKSASSGGAAPVCSLETMGVGDC